ncbi:MAG: cadmium-translocating P-type ATPase [Bacilli bacterium]|nr:cadmium-translocating P-type ATPase [Bacilli bacterium]
MKKYRFKINNLDCANCAKKLEDTLNNNSKMKNVVVNFVASKISYESDSIDLDSLNELIKKVEPNCFASTSDVKENKEYHVWILVLSLIIGIIGLYIKLPFKLNLVFLLGAYILLLYRPFMNAIKLLKNSKTINENALIFISCVGAFLIGEKLEGIMVVALYTLGKILEEKAINNTRRSIKGLMDIKQDYANLKDNNKIKEIEVEEIKKGDILVVKKGERIPVDGTIVLGTTRLDTSMLTGESEYESVKVGSKVLSGSINLDDVIEMKATKLYDDSTVAKILELVEEASDKKANTETVVARMSKIYTPSVLILAILVTFILPIAMDITFSESLYRGLTFLVISCPCAIAISVPLSYFTGIGVASKNGILIKGSNYLDLLGHVNKLIFDKTGTLTTGSFRVTDIKIYDDSYKEEEIIELLVKGESFSNHPIAKSIMKLSKTKYDTSDVKNYKEIDGEGISYQIGNKKIKVGTSKLCNCDKNASLHLNINGKHVASISIDDGIKENVVDTINKLKDMKIRTYMFTGDRKEVALEIGNKIGIDVIKYEMLPTDKYKAYGLIDKGNSTTAFIGDGVNDAPVLKRADIGISMGGVGSNSAIEASDVVFMTDDLSKMITSINISKYTNMIIMQNLIFAISVKIIILLLSVYGLASMWFAVFADTGVTVLTILNTLRIMHKFKK